MDQSTGELNDEAMDVNEPLPYDRAQRPWRLITVAAFLLGIVIGAFGFAALSPVSKPQASVDSSSVRDAARAGVMDAFATLQAGGSPSAESQNTGTAVDPASFKIRDANLVGSKSAKVTLIEFSDFQCPFCERFHQTAEAALIQQYVDTGKVAFVYKHSAFLGQESIWAAQAAECAADQGKFWQFHDLLFARQNGENQGTFTKDKLIGFAQDLQLDMTQFEPCLNNDQTLDRVQADTQEGQQAGVRGTPTFFINGQPIVGAQPLETFQAAIDQALSGQ
jgi:protein-disulfide isomerase